MRFGKTLRNSIYSPWSANYIDYPKLKALLREDESQDGDGKWTDEDESKFVEELVNVQLEKVNAFQADLFKNLKDRTSECETNLENIAQKDKDSGNGNEPSEIDRERRKSELQEVLDHLDNITKKMNELEKYSRINYTGFLKAGKKHDRRRGTNYKVRPLLQVRLAALPFNQEDYSPLLYRLSAMYSYVRQNLAGPVDRSTSASEPRDGAGKYTSHKCKCSWSKHLHLG
jgi:SPX domain protein involved in polyphosphate accumulation